MFEILDGSTGTVSAMISGTSRLYYQAKLANNIWDNYVDFPAYTNKGHYWEVGTGSDQ